jgi:hypothetical protein
MTIHALLQAASRRILLVSVYVLVAAASFCGMYAKHSFGDGDPAASLTRIMDGTAARPYVYRQLLPTLANLGAKAIPARIQTRFVEHLALDAPAHNPLVNTFARALDPRNPRYALRYYLVYALTFGALVAGMLMLRAVCLDLSGDDVAATIAPLAFALAVPMYYYYDCPELFFMALAVWIARRANVLWLVPLTLVATFNKESFVCFAIALYPFLRARRSRGEAFAVTGACVALGALVNVLVKWHFAANPGAPALFNLGLNLRFLADPRNYLLSEWTYGILLPKGFNVLILFVLAVLVRAGWRGLPAVVKRHAWFALAINVPLFLLFGYEDEVRALSMLDIVAALLICTSLSGYLRQAARTAAAPAGTA